MMWELTLDEWEKTCCLTPDLMHPFLGMYDGLEHIAFLLTSDTGDAGTSPHVARRFFNDIPWQILLSI